MYKEQVHKLWKNKGTSNSEIFQTAHHNANYLLERENYKVLKIHANNSCYFEISTSHF